MSDVCFSPIGTIHTPFTRLSGMPIQPSGDRSAVGRIEILPQFSEGLKDLEGFSHLILLYHLHRAAAAQMTVTPYLDDRPHGVFATRSPARPNPIGLSVVRLIQRDGTRLHIGDVDILDGTPLLDIKPAVPEFDFRPVERTGWMEQGAKSVRTTLSDSRFVAPGNGHPSFDKPDGTP